jgi:predicted acylesterase/phospholipase RssA
MLEVIAVDVAQPFRSGPCGALPGIVDTIGRAMTLASWRGDDPQRALACTVITPDLDGLGLFDFGRLDELVDRGRAAGSAAVLGWAAEPDAADPGAIPADQQAFG